MEIEIETVRREEEHNYQISQRHLGDTTALVQDVVILYKKLVSIITSEPNPSKEILSRSPFLLRSQYQFVIASLACLRAHLTDAYIATRVAVEAVAYAVRIKERPDLAEKWLQAWRSNDAYKKYKKAFKKLYPKDDLLLQKLYVRYDLCSKQIHNPIHAYSRKLFIEEHPDLLALKMDYFEVDLRLDPGEPVRTLLWLVDTHFLILRIFADKVFEEVISKQLGVWDDNMNAVAAKLQTHVERWRPYLEVED